jgi:hypothetical protein
MALEEDLRGLLLAAAAGGAALTPAVEVNWDVHTQGVALPGVVLTLVSGGEGIAQDGPTGLEQVAVQVDAYAATPGAALALAREIRTVLHGFRGDGATGFFEGIFLTATRSGREAGANEAERPFRQSMDFDVNWRAT